MGAYADTYDRRSGSPVFPFKRSLEGILDANNRSPLRLSVSVHQCQCVRLVSMFVSQCIGVLWPRRQTHNLEIAQLLPRPPGPVDPPVVARPGRRRARPRLHRGRRRRVIAVRRRAADAGALDVCGQPGRAAAGGPAAGGWAGWSKCERPCRWREEREGDEQKRPHLYSRLLSSS